MIAWLKRAVSGGKRFKKANNRLKVQLKDLEIMDDTLQKLCQKLDGIESVVEAGKEQQVELRRIVASYRPPSPELHVVPDLSGASNKKAIGG